MTMPQNIGGQTQGLDPEKYLAMAASLDLSETEQRTLINTLIEIMEGFADAGFQAIGSETPCGQFAIGAKNPPSASREIVELEPNKPTEIGSAFDEASDQCETPKE